MEGHESVQLRNNRRPVWLRPTAMEFYVSTESGPPPLRLIFVLEPPSFRSSPPPPRLSSNLPADPAQSRCEKWHRNDLAKTTNVARLNTVCRQLV